MSNVPPRFVTIVIPSSSTHLAQHIHTVAKKPFNYVDHHVFLTVRDRVNRIYLIFGYQAGLTRYQDPLIAVSQGLTAAVVILSAVSGLAGEDHLRVLGVLCGSIVWLYVGMAVMVRRRLAALLQLGVTLAIYVLAL